MISNAKLVLFTIFLLIAIVCEASNSVHSHRGKKHHQDRHHRSVADNEIGGDSRTSCGKSLCTTMDIYPEKKIHSAWHKFHRLVQSDKAVFTRVFVDSGYLNQLSNAITDKDRNEDFILRQNKCKTEATILYPLEGKSTDDNEVYYIINVKGFSQSVQQKICNSCEPDPSMYCEQETRQQKLLVIPVKKHSFTAEDVTVKSFEVPYSCGCFKIPVAIHVQRNE